MKTKLLLLTLIISGTFKSYSQCPDWMWAKKAGGTLDDAGQAIARDASGNIYTTGYFWSDSLTFGNNTLYNAGASDVFLAKYDASGNALWAQYAGGNSMDRGLDIATDRFGNVFITGYFGSSTIAFGNDILTTTGSHNFFIAKYDASGNELWAKCAGGNTDAFGNGIATDYDGNVYITGSFSSSSIILGNDTLNCAFASHDDMFIAKFDSSGNMLWAKRAGGTDHDKGSAIAVDSSGNAYVTGYFGNYSTIIFGTDTLTSSGDDDIFVTKYTNTGTVLWAKKAGGNLDDVGNGIALDKAHHCYVTGSFNSSSINFTGLSLTNAGYMNVFVTKYDDSGNVLWAKSAGGSYVDAAHSVATDGSSNIYITGLFGSVPSVFGDDTLINNGTSNIFVTRYDSSGNVIWAKGTGGIISDWGYGIAADDIGNIFITGFYNSPSVIFDPDTLLNAGAGNSHDYFVAKIGSVPTEISGNDFENNLEVFPNPSAGNFTVTFLNTIKTGTIEIYTVLGKQVFNERILNTFRRNINLANASDGIYLLKVSDGERQYSKKLMIGQY